MHYKGKSIAEVLDMPIEEAPGVLRGACPTIARHLAHAQRGRAWAMCGSGSPRPTLSGGEAQRVKLASELQKRSTGRTVYVLDEPTTGLHFEDISKLISVLSGLVDKGNTVIVIEHNLDVIKTADWVVDMGPEGGSGGGLVIAEGTPEEVASVPASHTGKFLRDMLGDWVSDATVPAARNGGATAKKATAKKAAAKSTAAKKTAAKKTVAKKAAAKSTAASKRTAASQPPASALAIRHAAPGSTGRGVA
ncbi:UvrABC system protein A [Streptomyces antimycoticus]